jgi:hypothetical protein
MNRKEYLEALDAVIACYQTGTMRFDTLAEEQNVIGTETQGRRLHDDVQVPACLSAACQ